MTSEERRKNSASFEVNDMQIENNELKNLAYQIQISFMNLEKTMVTKEDIKDMIDKMISTHGEVCPIKKMDLITVTNFHEHWKLSNAFHKEESLKVFDTWSDRLRKNAGWFVSTGILLYYAIDWKYIFDALIK